jgi:levanase
MNEPNGLVFYDGEYHLFFQHNPFGNAWGNMSWGHAVSRDLVHWTQLPVAIPAEGDELIFSGSAVVDRDDTSGFGTPGNPPMVAIYTSARPGSQAQSLAYSLDHGRTSTKYAGNPVLDIGSSEFRDPKVF